MEIGILAAWLRVWDKAVHVRWLCLCQEMLSFVWFCKPVLKLGQFIYPVDIGNINLSEQNQILAVNSECNFLKFVVYNVPSMRKLLKGELCLESLYLGIDFRFSICISGLTCNIAFTY